MVRPETFGTVLLDASALLGVVTGEAAFASLRALLEAVDRGDVTLFESTAILAEVLPRHDSDTVERRRARDALRELLESPATVLVDVSAPVARKAGDLRAQLGLKTWDAVHLATAIVAGVDLLIVRDHRFPEGDYEGVYVTGPFDLDEGLLF